MTNLKIYLILIGLIGALGTGFKFYYDYAQAQMEILEGNIAKAELAIESQKKAFNDYKVTTQQQLSGINNIQQQQRRIEEKTGELELMLARHRLDQLAAEKPGLIERKANAATKRVFRDIESASTLEEPKSEEIE